jgi:hypothetical protein
MATLTAHNMDLAVNEKFMRHSLTVEHLLNKKTRDDSFNCHGIPVIGNLKLHGPSPK